MTTLFISDLHLDDERPELTEFFFGFIDRIAINSNRLFILGDFFEAWIGDDEQSSLQVRIANKLSELANTGVEILIMHGNRDFLLGSAYAAQCGARLIDEPWHLTIGGKNTLLMHGDSLCTDDIQYMKFRELARNTTWQKQVLNQSLETRKKMAHQLRQASEANNSDKSSDIMDVAKHTVNQILNQHDADILLHGHTHRPAEHSVKLQDKIAKRIVLGDWQESTWYARSDDHDIQLIHLRADQVCS